MQEMREMRPQLLEKEMATHFSILAWENMDRGAWWATVRGGHKELDTIEHACTQLHLSTHLRTRSH